MVRKIKSKLTSAKWHLKVKKKQKDSDPKKVLINSATNRRGTVLFVKTVQTEKVQINHSDYSVFTYTVGGKTRKIQVSRKEIAKSLGAGLNEL